MNLNNQSVCMLTMSTWQLACSARWSQSGHTSTATSRERRGSRSSTWTNTSIIIVLIKYQLSISLFWSSTTSFTSHKIIISMLRHHKFYHHIPLSSNFQFSKFSKNSKFRKTIPKSRILFQNFQSHKGAANDIKGAAASLLVISKISIFNRELP